MKNLIKTTVLIMSFFITVNVNAQKKDEKKSKVKKAIEVAVKIGSVVKNFKTPQKTIIEAIKPSSIDKSQGDVSRHLNKPVEKNDKVEKLKKELDKRPISERIPKIRPKLKPVKKQHKSKRRERRRSFFHERGFERERRKTVKEVNRDNYERARRERIRNTG